MEDRTFVRPEIASKDCSRDSGKMNDIQGRALAMKLKEHKDYGSRIFSWDKMNVERLQEKETQHKALERAVKEDRCNVITLT